MLQVYWWVFLRVDKINCLLGAIIDLFLIIFSLGFKPGVDDSFLRNCPPLISSHQVLATPDDTYFPQIFLGILVSLIYFFHTVFYLCRRSGAAAESLPCT